MTTDQQPTQGDPSNDQSDDPAGLRRQIADLRKENGTLKEQVAGFERTSAFDKAGIPADGPAKWFRQGYTGDLTPEAIKAAAEADGILAPPPPPPPDTDPVTAAAHGDIDDFVDDATPPAIPAAVMTGMAEAAAQGGPDGIRAFMESQGLTG